MIGGDGDEVSIMPVVYPLGTVSVSLLGIFCLLVHHLNLLILSFLSLLYYTAFKSVSIIIGGGGKIHQDTGG